MSTTTYCKNCGGTGWLSTTPMGQDSTCPACRGTGKEARSALTRPTRTPAAAAKIGPFTVVPNMDPYTRPPTRLPGFRIAGYCEHLSPGASRVSYVNEADAVAWCEQHVATYHDVTA